MRHGKRSGHGGLRLHLNDWLSGRILASTPLSRDFGCAFSLRFRLELKKYVIRELEGGGKDMQCKRASGRCFTWEDR